MTYHISAEETARALKEINNRKRLQAKLNPPVPSKQRLIRVLVYEGTASWIQYCLAHRGLKGSYKCNEGVIKEAIVGDFLEEILK